MCAHDPRTWDKEVAGAMSLGAPGYKVELLT